MATTAAGDRLVYRPLSGRIGAACFALLALWWAVALVLGGHPRQALIGVPLLAAAVAAVWAVFWRPAVVVDDDAVLLLNPVRDVRVPWPALEDVDTRFALTLTASGRRYQSWAAAAPGRGLGLSRGPADRGPVLPAGAGAGGVKHRPSRALTSHSGAAAFMVEQRWEARRDAGAPGDVPAAVTVRRHLDLASVVAGGVLLGVLAALLT